MPTGPVWLRRFKGLVFILAISIVTASSFVIGYRMWAYNGWMEYRLTCVNTHVDVIEISLQATPELQDAIDAHFTYMSSGWTGRNHPYYRKGEQFYMRPWYYINSLEFRINNTSRITKQVLGSGSGEVFCWKIYENPKLFSYDPHRDDPTNYIYSQHFIWLLSSIAPRLMRDQ